MKGSATRLHCVVVGALAFTAAVAALSGCGADNSLGGSVSELFDLEVSRVEILRNAEALQVSYYRNRAANVDLVARLTVALEGLTLQPGEKIDLAGTYAADHLRTTVVHIAGDEPARVFPPVKQGELNLTEGGNVGEVTRGEFSLSFEQNGGYGSGRTLFGTFRAPAQDAGFDP